MNLVSLADLGSFLDNVFQAFEGYLFLAFTLMIATSVLLSVRSILIGVKS